MLNELVLGFSRNWLFAQRTEYRDISMFMFVVNDCLWTRTETVFASDHRTIFQVLWKFPLRDYITPTKCYHVIYFFITIITIIATVTLKNDKMMLTWINILVENRISWLILLLTHHLLAGWIEVFLEYLDVHFGNVPCNFSDYMWEWACHTLNKIDYLERARPCSVQLHLNDYQIPCYIDGLDILSSLVGIANALPHLLLWVWLSLLLHCHPTIFSVEWNKLIENSCNVNSWCWRLTYVNWYFNS